MKKIRWKPAAWAALGLGLVAILVRAFQPTPVPIDAAVVSRGTLRVSVDDDGRTRVRERYTISAPIDGRLVRTALDPGDRVRVRDTLVAEFAPVAPDLLDARSREEAEARFKRAEAAYREAEARAAQATADERYATEELERIDGLSRQGVESQNNLDRARRDERRAHEGLRAAKLSVEVARYEREVARASLVEARPELLGSEHERGHASSAPVDGYSIVGLDRLQNGGRLLLRSPIEGTVLRVFEESARTLPAGTPILEVGNTAALEIVADYLSQDAVRVRPGMEVLIEGWGGQLPSGEESTLRGRVRVIEPGGFMKVSALGVEEQRVNIVVDPVGNAEDWITLGDSYRVELRIILWEEDDVLIVPTGALFREGEAWTLFVVEDGRARRREVLLGRRNGLEAQVLSGLEEGDRVVLYPSEFIADGTRVEAR